ncbi:nuclear division cycle 1 [Oratosquilla oratoria]|uniref:nuclear division cycle 1 n=1 Tax=Oratosquilla oratoria TaxID=337810 RepID=UPI003F75860B
MKVEEFYEKRVLLGQYMTALCCMIFMQAALCTCIYWAFSMVPALLQWEVSAAFDHLIIVAYPSFLWRHILPSIIFIFFTRFHARNYSVYGWVPEQGWQYIQRLLRLSTLFHYIIIPSCCSYLVSHYATLVSNRFQSLAIPCPDGDGHCLNNDTLFVMFVGFVLGFRFATHYHLGNGGLVTFDVVQPGKVQSFKAKFNLNLVKEALHSNSMSVSTLLLVALAYTLVGATIRSFVASTLKIAEGDGWTPWMLLDLPLLLAVGFSILVVASLLQLFIHIMRIFVTEPIEFPVTSLDGDDEGNCWILCQGLVAALPILQLHAFRDLHWLAASDPARRAQVFEISEPGGHPRNWQDLVNPTLNIVRKFTEKLRKHNCPEESSTTTAQSSTDVNKNEVAKVPTITTVKEKVKQVLHGLKQYPVFCFFLSNLPEATNRAIFAEAQPVLWAIQALGDLVAASYTEDKFGVVQRNTADIITAILELQQVVEKVGRVTIRRSEAQVPHDVQLRRALRLAIKSSLYSITNVFKLSVRDISLSADHQKKLSSYLEFKES